MIKASLSEYLLSVDNLRNLKRYQTAPRISTESVAEHSFFVTAYILKLNDYFDFNLEKALKMAILHDFAESYISDVPHPIKQKFPIIREQLDHAEYEVNSEFIGKEFANSIVEFNECSSIEGIIVALSDILSVISYSKYEIELGNSHYMKDVYDKATDRLRKVLYKAIPYLKNDINIDNILDEINNFMKANYI